MCTCAVPVVYLAWTCSLPRGRRARRPRQVTLATLPLAKYPRLVECAIPMTACDDPEPHYQFGVEMFMAGVAALAAARSAQPAS